APASPPATRSGPCRSLTSESSGKVFMASQQVSHTARWRSTRTDSGATSLPTFSAASWHALGWRSGAWLIDHLLEQNSWLSSKRVQMAADLFKEKGKKAASIDKTGDLLP